VLKRLGAVLRRSFRDEDVVARWGGEEFVVGMYGMGCPDGVTRLYRVLDAVRHEPFASLDGQPFNVTFSAGIAEFPLHGLDLQSLYHSSDEALYAAKEAGRARVVAAHSA
jgi:diguanylate cyclase (GGDEF)-like protein